jgi:hypothetical protein
MSPRVTLITSGNSANLVRKRNLPKGLTPTVVNAVAI